MIVSGGATIETFQCDISDRPFAIAVLPMRAIGAAASPEALNGTSISFVARSRTSSMPQKRPSPRTSPIDGCFACSFGSSTSSTLPMAAAFSTIPSSLKMLIDATAEAQASG